MLILNVKDNGLDRGLACDCGVCRVLIMTYHRVHFWPCERCSKNLHPGANLLLLLRWSKFICTRVQFVHMNANCLISIRFDREF